MNMRIVLKIGTSSIIRQNSINEEFIDMIAEGVSLNIKKGLKFVLVSSGAIGLGKFYTNIKNPKSIPEKQAAASVGQLYLMNAYKKAFDKRNIQCAQLLFTATDLSNRERFLNIQNTFKVLLKSNIIPIINENDTVAVEEIKIGDNDTLSALVSLLVKANILTIFTDVDGLYMNKDDPSTLIKKVKKIDSELFNIAGQTNSKFGTGGMYTKLKAAQIATDAGISVYIISNKKIKEFFNMVDKVINIGTFFEPSTKSSQKMSWLKHNSRTKGKIVIDQGAKEALFKNKSLLPSGVIDVVGNFKRADIIEISDQSGNIVAKGLTNYSSNEILRIKGSNTRNIYGILGYKFSDEIVHKDYMIII
ncbi:Glutamate 5-kinase [Thermodesulfobium narugense DSM 14796]|uniref:Glutamate 5-kinase n=1 Tax=Thermodesulfobium narugense DSM 14796 TaxID=747365 RepID=M1E5B9_9BACT|nr:glutamate 5-kinase [Thermodesulfobium narugense]AEE14977.1 Glutamate 5-kinase [Thermodesulfobium narugense DSM 14796]